MYKQTIVPLFDYADFLIESGKNKYSNRPDELHVKGLRIIDANRHRNDPDSFLEKEYGLLTPTMRRHEHHSMVMYGQRGDVGKLDTYRPAMVLRSNRCIKFCRRKTNLCGIDKSPMMRGIKIWNLIPPKIQGATTKVKFKVGLRKLHSAAVKADLIISSLGCRLDVALMIPLFRSFHFIITHYLNCFS